MAKRYLEKFTSADGVISYTFPLKRYEYVPTQTLRSPRLQLSAQDYAVRLRGSAPSLLEVAQERVRCVFTGTASEQDDEADEARSKLYLGAFGKLYTLGDDSTRRWAEAELAEMPEITVRAGENLLQPMVFGFNRFSQWFAETQIEASETITSSGQTFVVNNPGLLPAKRVNIRIRSNSAAGFTNPKVSNLTNGHEFETGRDAASADDEVKLDTSVPSLGYSTDNGSTYADDIGQYVAPPNYQKALSFWLEPGDNTLEVESGGTVNCDVEITAEAAFP